MSPADPKHDPARSLRKARFCTECNWREFGKPEANCPQHGKAKTIDQPDHPYRGHVPRLATKKEEQDAEDG